MAMALDVKDGKFDTVYIEKLMVQKDEIGDLARVFREMSEEIYAREKQLKDEVRHLTIQIDETRKRMQVAEITETDYFHDLRIKAERLRSRSSGSRP